MNKVYIIWQEYYSPDPHDCSQMGVDKVFSCKQTAEEYLEYAEKELAWEIDEDGYYDRLYTFSLTEHELI